nr:unnamed protein product [Digitaria exilis]
MPEKKRKMANQRAEGHKSTPGSQETDKEEEREGQDKSTAIAAEKYTLEPAQGCVLRLRAVFNTRLASGYLLMEKKIWMMSGLLDRHHARRRLPALLVLRDRQPGLQEMRGRRPGLQHDDGEMTQELIVCGVGVEGYSAP